MISDKTQKPNATTAYFNVDFFMILSSCDMSTSYYLILSLSLLYFM